MDILAKGKYSKHIALFAKLLRLDNLKISYSDNIIDDELKTYYKQVSSIVKKETSYDIQPIVLEQLLIQNDILDSNTVILSCDESISKAEEDFINMIDRILNLSNTRFLEVSISHIVKRQTNETEIIYHQENNLKKNINVFMWICILNLCKENKNLGYRDFFINGLKNIPITKSRVAVLFCGYLRQNKYESHLQLINSPHTDVFIHTWDEHGFKNNRRLIDKSWLSNNKTEIDIDLLKNQYKPVKIKIENNYELLDELSLINKIKPIFLYSGQAKDDASKFINSQLYSIYSAYQLMCEYEKEQGFKYDAIIRLRFDYNITHLDWTSILQEINLGSEGMYFPHASCNSHSHPNGGGGCLSCDKDIEHEKHTNDMCDIWCYGTRHAAGIACETYLHALDIMKINHEANMEALKTSRYSITKDGNFVYISSTKDIENEYVCMYPERLSREHLTGISCKSSKHIQGRI